MLTTEEKRSIYTQRIANLREAKIAETRKKLNYFGYTDEDDYNNLVPPEDYHWEPIGDTPNGDFHGYLGWAKNFKSMVESFPPVVVPESSMAGNYYMILHKYRKLRWHESWDLSPFEYAINKYDIDHCLGQIHHLAGDVRIGLELGWGGLLKKVKHFSKVNNNGTDQKEFYEAEITFLETCIDWIQRTIFCIREKLEAEKDPLLKENLQSMLDTNEWIKLNPPRTLREACQFICWYNIFGRCYNREGCGGQLDEILRPYYEKDISSQIIDDEDAIYYIAGVLLSDTKYYQLGGVDIAGRDMVSHISWLILDAADRLNITSNLTVRVHNNIDRRFLQRCIELLFKHKNGWPRFSGDQSLVEGCLRYGFPPEVAYNRIAVGCNWMATPGIEYPLNDSIKVNFAKLFEVAWYDMMVLDAAPSTEKLMAHFTRHLKIVLQTIADTTDMHLRLNYTNSPELFLNLFCVGPIEKGCDVSNHSVEYYTIGVDGAGIAVAADSFAAVQQRVENEKKLNWLQVHNAIKTNFECPDGPYIQNLLHTANKYGQWNSLSEQWVKRIRKVFCEIVLAQGTKEGERFIPGIFSWSQTIHFGKTVGATPDGRLAGAPINHGANPMPGSVQSGAMTTMSEAILAAQCGYGNTSPFQIELDPGLSNAQEAMDKVLALFETHLRRGGTLINVNIVDAEKIRAAHANPELYPDLVVRVTGFTAYFISLSPEFRQLVVDRLIEKN